VDELLVRMETISRQQSDHKPFVEFDQNVYLKGLEFFGDLFNYIQNKRVLNIKYQSFKLPKPIKYLIHPYFLKQYNGRWFLLGYTEEHGSITNLALDRIEEIKDTDDKYIENKAVDFEEYFEDVIGVTVQKDENPQKIRLFIEKDRWPYIKSKPLHGSQKIKSENEKGAVIEIEVQINNELVTLIFSYGESIEVLSPEELKTKIIEKAKMLLKNYR
jgi:predicted DNA-binding transcriptional regulator YafY